MRLPRPRVSARLYLPRQPTKRLPNYASILSNTAGWSRHRRSRYARKQRRQSGTEKSRTGASLEENPPVGEPAKDFIESSERHGAPRQNPPLDRAWRNSGERLSRPYRIAGGGNQGVSSDTFSPAGSAGAAETCG